MIDTASTWKATTTTARVTIKSVPTDAYSALLVTLSKAVASATTELNGLAQQSLSRAIRGAQASLTILNAQQVLATATDMRMEQEMRANIYDASLNLQELAFEKNWYRTNLSGPANVIYFIIFIVSVMYTLGMWYKSRYQWYNVSFGAFQLLQSIGWLSRVLSAYYDNSSVVLYLLQLMCLSISVAFLMGGIYFLFGQLIVIYGREYSMLKPLWYSYMFISCDIAAIIVQVAGCVLASLATIKQSDRTLGTDLMTTGIIIQTAALGVYLCFWFIFLWRIYFRRWKEAVEWKSAPCAKPGIFNFLKFLFNVKLTREYRESTLDLFYNPQFAGIRARPLFPWFPLVLSVTGLILFIRCVYRIAELKQGLTGYLITHEAYLLTLAAPMVAITTLSFIPFHPVWVFGPQNKVKMALIISRADEASHKQRWGKESIWLS